MIKILWSNLSKYIKEVNLNEKMYFKLHNVKKVNMIDSKFIPKKVEEYIENNIKYKYVTSYNYKNNILNLNYFCSKKINNTELFKK